VIQAGPAPGSRSCAGTMAVVRRGGSSGNERRPQAWVKHTQQKGLVMSVPVHAPPSHEDYGPLLRAAERVLAPTWGPAVR
jgi:hypothetical protein